jgi:hypothetical protein
MRDEKTDNPSALFYEYQGAMDKVGASRHNSYHNHKTGHFTNICRPTANRVMHSR